MGVGFLLCCGVWIWIRIYIGSYGIWETSTTVQYTQYQKKDIMFYFHVFCCVLCVWVSGKAQTKRAKPSKRGRNNKRAKQVRKKRRAKTKKRGENGKAKRGHRGKKERDGMNGMICEFVNWIEFCSVEFWEYLIFLTDFKQLGWMIHTIDRRTEQNRTEQNKNRTEQAQQQKKIGTT